MMKNTLFQPAWWLTNPHLQTLWPTLFRRIKNIPLERERLELPDGDFVDLDWHGKNRQAPIVLILHGFEGSIQSPYAKGMLQAIYQHGWCGVFMHFRGCSGEPNRLLRGYHSGETEDLANVIDILKQRVPHQSLAVIGFSLGGNVLLKWLGETSEKNPLTAAIAISVPFELHKAAKKIDSGFSRIYQQYFLKSLRERLGKKFRMKGIENYAVLSDIRTIEEFDDKITAPIHGFKNAKEYYIKSSSRQFLHAIRVPTLIIHAKDDPFMPKDVIPESYELADCVQLELTEKGGHVGFISGEFPWCAEYWLEKRVPAYLRQYF